MSRLIVPDPNKLAAFRCRQPLLIERPSEGIVSWCLGFPRTTLYWVRAKRATNWSKDETGWDIVGHRRGHDETAKRVGLKQLGPEMISMGWQAPLSERPTSRTSQGLPDGFGTEAQGLDGTR